MNIQRFLSAIFIYFLILVPTAQAASREESSFGSKANAGAGVAADAGESMLSSRANAGAGLSGVSDKEELTASPTLSETDRAAAAKILIKIAYGDLPKTPLPLDVQLMALKALINSPYTTDSYRTAAINYLGAMRGSKFARLPVVFELNILPLPSLERLAALNIETYHEEDGVAFDIMTGKAMGVSFLVDATRKMMLERIRKAYAAAGITISEVVPYCNSTPKLQPTLASILESAIYSRLESFLDLESRRSLHGSTKSAPPARAAGLHIKVPFAIYPYMLFTTPQFFRDVKGLTLVLRHCDECAPEGYIASFLAPLAETLTSIVFEGKPKDDPYKIPSYPDMHTTEMVGPIGGGPLSADGTPLTDQMQDIERFKIKRITALKWSKLQEIGIVNIPVKADVMQDLISSTLMPQLTALRLNRNMLWMDSVAALAHSDNVSNLVSLDLTDNFMQSLGLQHLCTTSKLPKLKQLRVGGNGIKAVPPVDMFPGARILSAFETLKILAKSKVFAGLEVLDLSRSALDKGDIEALSAFPTIKAPEALILENNSLDNETMTIIAKSKKFSNLRRLHIRGNPITDTGLFAIADANELYSLTELKFDEDKCTKPLSIEALQSRFHKDRVLKRWIDYMKLCAQTEDPRVLAQLAQIVAERDRAVEFYREKIDALRAEFLRDYHS